MTVKTVNLDNDMIIAAEQRAQELSKEYGITVSFSEIVRRALVAFLMPDRSTDRPKDYEKTADPVAA